MTQPTQKLSFSVLLTFFSLFVADTISAPCNLRVNTDIKNTIQQIAGPITQDNVNIRPYNNNDDPINVQVGFHLMTIYDFVPNDEVYKIGGFLRHKWTDPRLCYNESTAGPLGYIVVKHDNANIWLPDTYYSESLTQSDVEGNNFLRIWPNGTILYSQQTIAQLKNPLELRDFPFNVLSFRFIIESYGLTIEEMTYSSLFDNPLSIEAGVQKTSSWTLMVQPAVIGDVTYSTGKFPQIVMNFDYRFVPVKVLISVLIPSLTVGFLAPLTLLLKSVDSLGARLSAGIGFFIAIFGLMFAMQNTLPSVSYVLTMEMVIIVTILFIGISLIMAIAEHKIRLNARKNTAKAFKIYKLYKNKRTGAIRKRYINSEISGMQLDDIIKIQPEILSSDFPNSIKPDAITQNALVFNVAKMDTTTYDLAAYKALESEDASEYSYIGASYSTEYKRTNNADEYVYYDTVINYEPDIDRRWISNEFKMRYLHRYIIGAYIACYSIVQAGIILSAVF